MSFHLTLVNSNQNCFYLFILLCSFLSLFSYHQLGIQEAVNNPELKLAVSIRLVALLEEIQSCCSGASMKISPILYKMFEPVYMTLSDLLEMFHNYQTVVVGIFSLLSETVYSIKNVTDNKISVVCINVIKTYCKHNGNRVSLESTAEKDNLEDLTLMLTLVSNFVSMSIFDTHGKPFYCCWLNITNFNLIFHFICRL